MVRIGGFRGAADAAVARSFLQANGIAARLVVDEAFGLHPAGNWEASLEVADDDHEAALELLAVDSAASHSPAAAGLAGTARSTDRPRAIATAEEAPRRWLQHPLVRILATLTLLGFLLGYAVPLLVFAP